jgi:hypothetical protein
METHIDFIDLEKAFDRVNRGKLWEILDKRGDPKHLINILGNICNETKAKIALCDGRFSQEIVINQGVRQGCSLSPMLFNIYVDDILSELKNKINSGIKLTNDVTVNMLLFADDMVILQENEDNLQKNMY